MTGGKLVLPLSFPESGIPSLSFLSFSVSAVPALGSLAEPVSTGCFPVEESDKALLSLDKEDSKVKLSNAAAEAAPCLADSWGVDVPAGLLESASSLSKGNFLAGLPGARGEEVLG